MGCCADSSSCTGSSTCPAGARRRQQVEARLAISADERRTVALLAKSFGLRVAMDLTRWQLEVGDLSRGRRDLLRHRFESGLTIFEQPDLEGDLVYVLSQ